MSGRDPDIAAFRAALAAAASPDPSAGLGSVAEIRASFGAQHNAVPPAEGCRVDHLTLGGVAVEALTPTVVEGAGALLYLHGGGHVFGSARSHRHLVSRLATAARRTAYVTDHRLAPEAPFPAGLGDALGAYTALLNQGLTADQIVVGGESAGGNLAAALLLALKARGLPLPAGLYLLSPWLDLTHAGAAHEQRAKADPLITTASLEDCARHYVGEGPRTNPLVSPVFGDLAGFSPMLIQVGSDEVLLSDSLTFAERAALVGVGVRLEVWPQMIHAWPLFHFALPTAGLAAIDGAGAWIAGRLGAG